MALRDDIAAANGRSGRAAVRSNAVTAAAHAKHVTKIPPVERRGQYAMTFVVPPAYIGNGAIEFYISVKRNGVELPIDGHRILVNPPVLRRKGKDNYEEDPWGLAVDALWDSLGVSQ